VVLPADFQQRYSAEEQALVLAHERLHLERGDIVAQGVATMLRCMFWFNPLVHYAAAAFRFDQELACDSDVLAKHPDSRRAYGEAMLKTQLADFGLPVGCHWQSSHPLKERISMLRKPLPGTLRRRTGLILVAAMVVSGSYAAWAAQPGKSAPATPMPAVSSITDADVLTPPAWPEGVAKDRTGNVWLNLLVAADGRVIQVKVESSNPAGVFDAAAVAAASQWRFNTARDNLGKKVQGWVRVPVQFAPHEPPATPPAG
jgi:TonB family protein